MPELQPVYVKAPPDTKTVTKQSSFEKKENAVEDHPVNKEASTKPAFTEQIPEVAIQKDHSKYILEDEEPIKFIFHRRKRNVAAPQVIGTFLAIGLLFAGWHNGWLPVNKNSGEQTVMPLVSSESHTAFKEKAKPVENKL